MLSSNVQVPLDKWIEVIVISMEAIKAKYKVFPKEEVEIIKWKYMEGAIVSVVRWIAESEVNAEDIERFIHVFTRPNIKHQASIEGYIDI